MTKNLGQTDLNEASITWTKPKLAEFKKYYEANKSREIYFTFEGHEFVMSYAKYLIEYLEMQFND